MPGRVAADSPGLIPPHATVVLLAGGLFLAAIPFLAPRHRSLGMLFIPAFLILTNGSILFIASLFNH